MSVGSNIKWYRKKAGLTQVALAEKANISRSYLGDVENGRYNVSLDVLERLAKALNVSTAVLLEEEHPSSYRYDMSKQKTINQILSTMNLLTDEKGYFFENIQEDVFNAIDNNLYTASAFHNSSEHIRIANHIRKYFKSPEEFLDAQVDKIKEEFNESYNYQTLKQILDKIDEKYLKDYLLSIQQLTKPYHGNRALLTNTITIPVLDTITASQHIEGLEYELVDPRIIRGRTVFGLKIKGDSMNGDGIYDGDTVIFVKQENVSSSDIAVVAVNEDVATLKRVKCENDMCMLIPSNSNLQPILVPAKDVHIIGKVIQSRRNFE